MKLREIFAFELEYQGRRASTWLFFVALFAIVLQITTEAYTGNARDGGYWFNAPFVIMSMTMLASAVSLLVSAAFAGDAAARDVQTRMHPIVFTAPVGKATYLGGRFLAAISLNAIVVLSVQLALLLSPLMPGVAPELIGPFRPAIYLAVYFAIALPNAFIGSALLFAISVLSRRSIAAYLGAIVLFVSTLLILVVLARTLNHWTLAKILDPLGFTIVSEISSTTTAAQKNMLASMFPGWLFINRVVWMTIALGALAFTHLRFRVDVSGSGLARRRRLASSEDAGATLSSGREASKRASGRKNAILVPRAGRFDAATRLRQTLAITTQAFREVAFGWAGLILLLLTSVVILLGPKALSHMGIPLLPTTQQMTLFVGNTGEVLWIIVPLITVYYVGELVWRDRDTGLNEIADAAPVPDWVRLLGKVAGLGLVFVAYEALLVAASMLVQVQRGYHAFELGLYARILFGLSLPQHLLFALLAFTVHVLVNQKYVGHMVVLICYALMTFAPSFGIENNLLVYGSNPGWTYSDMRGFGSSVAPWLWFNFYWAAWALLLAVAAKLFWVRAREQSVAARLRLARRRLTRATIGTASAAAALVIVLGGFIFYNTHVLNAYETSADGIARRVEYERRYGKYAGIAQPQLTGIELHVELYPRRREADIRGTYVLVNATQVPIDTIHLVVDPEVANGPARLDRPSTSVLQDDAVGYRMYALKSALLPGESLRLDFAIQFKPRGFRNSGVDPSVAPTATYFEGNDWLPTVGYETALELDGPGERREHGLPPRRAIRALEDVAARQDLRGNEHVSFEATIGTDAGQIAVAPGALRRSWAHGGRRYFEYATDAPIRNDFAIYSADYAVHETRWNGTLIQVVHDPRHTANVESMTHGLVASLQYFTKHFGPYAYGQLRLVEHPGGSMSLHASPVNISYFEEFSLLDSPSDPRRIDFPFAVVAHEVAHQWWGNQLLPADVEGAPLLSESLAWYSAICLVRETYGEEHLNRLMSMMREAYLSPRARAALPLLRASDKFHAYRKGLFAMYALREYVGAERVDTALRRMLEKYGTGRPPLPTSLDLYHELQVVTPDSLRYLLADLFEANTFWELSAKDVAVKKIDGAHWQMTLDVKARKVVVDTASVEKEVPMDDFVEIGVYGSPTDGALGEPLYLRMHRVRSGEQRITVMVQKEPASAGIDPRNLLIDVKPADNIRPSH